jgi:outer membrane protein assembly factor BamE (lipoprotein component of BamABCDE complex)
MWPVRKKHFAFAAAALLAALLTVGAVSLARHRTFDNRWAQVRIGMSKDEVRQLLGEPDHV